MSADPGHEIEMSVSVQKHVMGDMSVSVSVF